MRLLQGRTIHELHDDERQSVLFTDVVDGTDIGMVEGRGRLSLTSEAGKCQRVVRQ